MAIILSVALLFLGIVALVLIHVWVVSRAFRRGLHELGVTTDRTNLGSASMSRDDVEKLPCYAFKAKDQSSGSPADCAVCLDRFKAGEKCRLLPLCRHSFHAECVDVWLLRAAVCPICRARADNITAIAISGETVVAIELRDTVDNPVEEGHDHLELLQREESTQLSQENPGLSGIGMELSEEEEGSSSNQLGQVTLDLSCCCSSEQQESVESSHGNLKIKI